MQANYNSCLSFTLKQEGGWSNNPNDPGGETMQGITLSVYRAWKHDSSLSGNDLRKISKSDVSAIYHHDYWDKISADEIQNGVDLMVFDMQVNSGTHSAKILQATVGTSIDGTIGPVTIAATNAIDASRLIASLAVNQAAFYRSLSTFASFGRGWINRTNARRAAALALATTSLHQSRKSRPMAKRVVELPEVAFYASIRHLT